MSTFVDVDHEWARKQLTTFIKHADRWLYTEDEEGDGLDFDAVTRLRPIVQEIMNRTIEDPAIIETHDNDVLETARMVVMEALGFLDVDESREKLGPGSRSPYIYASSMHPWVWNAANAFLDSGHYSQAVEQAWKSINAYLQQKVGRRELSDDELVNEIFSPPKGSQFLVKLLVPGDQQTRSWLSKQRGMHHLGQAVVAGIRNILAHEHLEISEIQALEYLAMMSVLARWADEAEVVPGKSVADP